MVAVKNEDPMPDHEVEVVGRAEEEASDRRVGATTMEAGTIMEPTMVEVVVETVGTTGATIVAATVVGKVNDHASAAAAVGN